MTDELKDKTDEVLEYEFRSHELIKDITENYRQENVEQAIIESVEDLLERVDTSDREAACYILAYQLGRAIESDKLVAYADEKVQELKAQ